jgi:hypothetical protein
LAQHEDKFEKVSPNEKVMYGPRRLILCGFSVSGQSKFKKLLKGIGLNNLPLVWTGLSEANQSLSSIFKKTDGSGEGRDSTLPRAIIAGGITQQELHILMSGCRKSGMKPSLWAVLTPTSENWNLSQLLAALAKEAEAMANR